MKKRRTIYIVIAVILITINLLVDVKSLTEGKFDEQGDAYSFGYFIGSQLFIIIGIVFLRLAYKLTVKIKILENKAVEDSIKNIGKPAHQE